MRLFPRALCALPFAALAACGSAKPCDDVTGVCVEFAAGASEKSIQDAVATAKDGTTFAFAEGTFAFTNTMTVAAKNITIKGMGLDKTFFDFKGLTAGGSGTGIDALDGSDGFTVVDFALRDSLKNGIKVKGSTGVTFRRVKVYWTNADPKTHGDYAVYPVFCKKVLIEDSDISGSSDAGIYVGQSQTIIVRRNIAHDNVAGIEIENSYDADVYDNTATRNTGGLLVFDLPGAGNQYGGHNVRVFRNKVDSNNTANFNPTGSTVAKVPAGTGTFVLGTRDVEVFDNTFSNNKTTGFAVVSYYIPAPDWDQSTEPNYTPISRRVWSHNNTFSKNGTSPDSSADLGLLLLSQLNNFPNKHVPDFVTDGVFDPAHAEPNAPAGNPMHFCYSNNTGDSDFLNINAPELQPDGSNFGAVLSTDGTAFQCQLTALPAVSF